MIGRLRSAPQAPMPPFQFAPCSHVRVHGESRSEGRCPTVINCFEVSLPIRALKGALGRIPTKGT